MSGRRLAGRLLRLARTRGLRLAVAESDTGGLVLSWLTAWPGSSAVVLGGVVAYADALKRGLLGVEPSLIAEHGAVSQAVVEAMARGICQTTGADLGLATTGIAGPGGARPGKPVGLAWLAVACAPGAVAHREAADPIASTAPGPALTPGSAAQGAVRLASQAAADGRADASAEGLVVVAREHLGQGGRGANRRASGRALLELALAVLETEPAPEKILTRIEQMCYIDLNRVDTTHA